MPITLTLAAAMMKSGRRGASMVTQAKRLWKASPLARFPPSEQMSSQERAAALAELAKWISGAYGDFEEISNVNWAVGDDLIVWTGFGFLIAPNGDFKDQGHAEILLEAFISANWSTPNQLRRLANVWSVTIPGAED